MHTNKFKSIFIILIFSLTFISCERTIDNVDLPFEERLFIEGMINTDRPVRVRVTRMIDPIKEEMGIDNIITDAEVKIFDGEEEYTLEHTDSQNREFQSYYLNLDMKIETGKTYELIVKWNGLEAKSSTTIPDSIKIYDWEKLESDDYNLRLYYDTLGLGEHFVRVSSEWSSPGSLSLIDYVYFDKPFRNYIDLYYWDLENNDDELVIEHIDPAFNAFLNSVDSDDDFFFGSSGTNPIGNVTGNGFGYFFGATWSRINLSEID